MVEGDTEDRDGVGGLRDGWFGESVTRKVGDETYTLFWSDPGWAGSLCARGLGACSI
jgi:hypothetical protein